MGGKEGSSPRLDSIHLEPGAPCLAPETWVSQPVTGTQPTFRTELPKIAERKGTTSVVPQTAPHHPPTPRTTRAAKHQNPTTAHPPSIAPITFITIYTNHQPTTTPAAAPRLIPATAATPSVNRIAVQIANRSAADSSATRHFGASPPAR